MKASEYAAKYLADPTPSNADAILKEFVAEFETLLRERGTPTQDGILAILRQQDDKWQGLARRVTGIDPYVFRTLVCQRTPKFAEALGWSAGLASSASASAGGVPKSPPDRKCSSSCVGKLTERDLRTFVNGSLFADYKIAGNVLQCRECDAIYLNTVILDETGFLKPNPIIQAALDGNEKVNLAFSEATFEKCVGIFPNQAPPATSVYRVVLGRHALTPRTHDLMGLLLWTVLAANTAITGRITHLVSIGVAGFGKDTRELYEVPEVKNWFFELHKKLPYLPFWLTEDDIPFYYATVTAGVDQSYLDSVKLKVGVTSRYFTVLLNNKIPPSARNLAAVEASVWGEGNNLVEKAMFSENPSVARSVIASATSRINSGCQKLAGMYRIGG